MVVGIEDNVFWELTPKTIQVYFRAYKKRRQIEIQDIWLQGQYFACAITSTLSFSTHRPPPYPKMPFENDDLEEEVSNMTEEQVQHERQRVYEHFMAILTKNK